MSSLTLRRAIILALAPATLISHTATAATGDDLPVVELDPVVVTVSRSATPLSDTPAAVSVIPRAEIEKNPARNLSDVIQSDAGIYVKQYGGIGQVPEIAIRGTNPNHTLVLKDGARLNTQNNLSPVSGGFYDLSDIDHVEIVKGPASVQYGSDAIGGVMQMVSKKPTRTSAELIGIVGENNAYKAIARVDVVHNGFYASLSGQRLETDGTRIFNTQARNDQAGYEQKGFGAKVGYYNDRIDTSVSFSENKGTNEYSSNGADINSQREFKNQLVNAKASVKVRSDVTLNARYSQAHDEQLADEPPSAWTTIDNHYNTKTDEYELNGKWDFRPNQNILVGVTGSQAEFDSNTITNNIQKVDTIGYYAQHQYNSDKLNTQVGVRLEDNDQFGNHTVGQAAARYHINPSTSVYANIGSAFRAPSLNELYTQWGGNPELEPEKSIAYELGITHQYGDHTSFDLSAYRNEVKNFIENPTWAKNINLEGKTKFTGGDLSVKYNRNNYFAKAQYSYLHTRNDRLDREASYRPKHTGALTVGYDDGIVGVSTSLIARSDAKHFDSMGNMTPVRGYATVDVDAHWNVNPYVKVFTNIQNIGNNEYSTAYDDYNKQWYVNGGRQANLGVTFKY